MLFPFFDSVNVIHNVFDYADYIILINLDWKISNYLKKNIQNISQFMQEVFVLLLIYNNYQNYALLMTP